MTVCSDPAMDAKRLIKSALQAGCTATAPIRPLPDYLIIGGQRCGTTALHDHLARHPAIGAAHVKEVHYFDLNYERGERWYRGHFPNDVRRAVARRRTGVEMVCGEASPYYLFHPLVPERARALVPDARLIVLLRDPVARALSHYHHEVALGMEPLTFEEALDAEPERLDGEERRLVQFPGYASVAHQHHSYVARGHYADQLERWLGRVPEGPGADPGQRGLLRRHAPAWSARSSTSSTCRRCPATPASGSPTRAATSRWSRPPGAC